MAGRSRKTDAGQGQTVTSWTRGQLLLVGLLLAAICVSSLAVVYTTHRARMLAHELSGMQQAAAQYEMEWHRLLLEQGVWAEQGRVLDLAQRKLGMRAPDPYEMVVVAPQRKQWANP